MVSEQPRCPAEPRRPTEARCPTEPHCPACTTPATSTTTAATAATAATTATAAAAAAAATAAMASPTVLTFDVEGRAVDCARYSSPATAALSRLMLPYLFRDLAAFTTVADLITHLRTSDAHYCAALPTEFYAMNPPPMDHFLSLCPTKLIVDLLEEHLAAAEKGILAGLRLLTVGGAATARARGARVVEGTAGAAAEAVEEAEGVAVDVGVVPRVGASVAAVEVLEAAAEVVAAAAALVEAAAAVVEVAAAAVLVEVQPRSVEALVWYAGRGRSGGAGPCTYVLRTGGRRGETCGLPHTAQRCFGRLTDAWRTQFPDAVELPRWGDLLKQNVAIFDLDFDAILAAMYAVTDSAESDCNLSVMPDPGIATAALGASASTAPSTGESAAPGAGESGLSGTAPTEALHTFTLDSGALRSFFRDNTTLMLLSQPVAVSLADPCGGPVLAHSSTVLPCLAAPSGLLSGLHLPSFSTNLVSEADLQDAWVDQFTHGGQRVTHCTCSPTSRHLATFTRRPGSSPVQCLPPARVVLCRTRLSFGTTALVTPPYLVFEYAAHQINLQPRVSLPETTPTLRWMGKVGDASVFRVWGSRAFDGDTSADKLSSHAVPCIFLGSPLTHPGGSSTTPPRVVFCPLMTSHHAEPVEVAVGSGAARGAELERVELGGAGTGGAEPRGAEPERMEPGGSECGGVEPGGVAPERVETGGTASGGAEPARAESGGSLGVPSRREPLSLQQLREWYARRCRGAAGAARGAAGAVGGAAGAGAAGGTAGAGAGGAAGGAAGAGAAGAAGAAGGAAGANGGAAGAGAAGAAGGATRAARGAAGAGAAGGVAGTGVVGGLGGARTGGTGAAGTGGAAGVVAGDPEAEGAGAVSAISGGAARPRPYYVPLLQHVLGLPPSPSPPPSLLSPPPVQSQGLTEHREPQSRPVSPESSSASPVRSVRAGRCVSRPRPPSVPRTHSMTLHPSTAPQRVPRPSPPASSLPDGPNPKSDSLHAASPTITRFLATAVTDPLFESTAASALVAELVDFAAACRLDYATRLVAESASASFCPPSVGGECALGTDVLEDRQEEFECFTAAVPHLVSMRLAPEGDPDAPDIPTPRSFAEAIEGPYSSQWQAAMDAEMASWKSTGTYVNEVPPPGVNIVSGMWIFRVKRPPGSPPAFKARYVARGFSHRQGVDFFQTFSPTPKMTTLWVLLHVAAQRDYELHSLDFSTAVLQGSLHEEIWLRRPPGFTGSFPPGTQWSLRRPVYDLRQSPREWHDTLRATLAALDDLVFATVDTEALAHVKCELQKRHTCTDLGELTSYLGLRITRDRAQRTITLTQSHMVQQVLQRFGFTYSSPQSTPLPTSHSLSAPPSDESVEPSGPYPELVGCLMYLMTCTRPDLAYPLSLLARYVAPGRHRKVHWDAAKRVLRYLCSTSGMGLVLGGWARVVLTGHADASWVDDLATQRSSQGYTFSLGSGSVSWRSTRSSSVLSSSCEAEIYAGAMAAQELRWLTYLLTDLGEAPRSPPVLYVDNKAMLALCQEHRVEHRSKHIALRYFLA
ncbi:unnamed protein product [Closterium sp. NIES-53]